MASVGNADIPFLRLISPVSGVIVNDNSRYSDIEPLPADRGGQCCLHSLSAVSGCGAVITPASLAATWVATSFLFSQNNLREKSGIYFRPPFLE